MYIFQSNLDDHSSFFIFHVNKANELTSISYCDGNLFDKKQKIKDSATHINGVTTFKLTTPIEYSYEKFVKNFIEKNTQNQKIEDFYKKYSEKTIAIEGAEIDYEKTTHSIPTRAQKRGNCAIKSTSLVARFILGAIDTTMKFGFDMASQKPTGAGYDKYNEFKDGLTKKTLESIIETKETISSKSDSLSDYLREEIEDIMKMVETQSTTKLSKDGQPRKEFHQEMNLILYPKDLDTPKVKATEKVTTQVEENKINTPEVQADRIQTPKSSCFSFIASCFSPKKTSQQKTPQR